MRLHASTIGGMALIPGQETKILLVAVQQKKKRKQMISIKVRVVFTSGGNGREESTDPAKGDNNILFPDLLSGYTIFLLKKKKKQNFNRLYFKSSFRFTAKLTKNAEHSHLPPNPTHAQPPPLSISRNILYICYNQ